METESGMEVARGLVERKEELVSDEYDLGLGR